MLVFVMFFIYTYATHTNAVKLLWIAKEVTSILLRRGCPTTFYLQLHRDLTPCRAVEPWDLLVDVVKALGGAAFKCCLRYMGTNRGMIRDNQHYKTPTKLAVPASLSVGLHVFCHFEWIPNLL